MSKRSRTRAQRNHSEQRPNEHPSSQQETTPADIHPIITPNDEPITDHSKTPETHWYTRFPWWKILQRVGIASAIILALLTYLQWSDQHTNFKRDQRAWVGIMKVQDPTLKDLAYGLDGPQTLYPVYIKEDEIVEFMILIMNFGKSPALNVRTIVSYKILKSDTPFRPDYGDTKPEGGITIFPQAQVSMTPRKIETATFREIRAIQTGTHVLYLFGQITYEDIFKASHETKFCMALSITREVFMSSKSCDPYNLAN